MDQLKQLLVPLKKHHFWILSGLAVLLSLVAYIMGSSALASVTKTNRGKVDSAFSTVDSASASPLYNQKWDEEMQRLNAALQKNVKDAWGKAYNDQKKLLVWPAWLGEAAQKKLADLKPADEIPRTIREKFQINVGKQEFGRLVRMVGAASPGELKAAEDATRTSVRPRAAAPRSLTSYRILWQSTSQEVVQKALTFSTAPSSADMRRAQENIWAWENLLQVINRVNQRPGADGKLAPTKTLSEARVREIRALLIGGDAIKGYREIASQERIVKPKDAPAESTAAATPTETTEGAADAAAAATPTPAVAVEIPLDKARYIDGRGKPIGEQRAMQMEFRRLPVLMTLLIEQTALPQLLVECANAPLPIEVLQLRVGGGKVDSATSQDGGPINASNQDPSGFWMVDVAGFVYLYNPPNDKLLNGEELPPDDGAAEGVAPAPVETSSGGDD